ncbi:ECF transporter S component [Flindersiella endophytica]
MQPTQPTQPTRPVRPTPPVPAYATDVLPLRWRSAAVIVLASVIGIAAYLWPFVAESSGAFGRHVQDAPFLFAVLVPLVVAVVAAELADGGIDAKAVAMLGMLAAVGAGLQALSPVTGGFDPVFALLIIAARVFGPGFGFALGTVAVVSAALLTGGVGPWLPFQMLGLGWVGLAAGCLPPAAGRWERLLLAGYACLAAAAYGALLNLWFWPYATYLPPESTFVLNAPLTDNLRHYATFYVTTSFGWDLLRAATNTLLVLLAGRPLLGALRRAARRAVFSVSVRS